MASPAKGPGNAPVGTASNSKRTQMNFYLQQDKQKMDAAAERLIHSVNAVTDLLKANTELRDTIEKMRRAKEDSDSEVFTLNIENQTLRERLELVEGILRNNRENYENLVSDKVKTILHKSNTQYGKFNMNAPLEQPPGSALSGNQEFTIDAVYTELIQLRQQNRVLETRIKQLEFQNFNMTRTGFPQTASKAQTPAAPVKNVEPSRPIFEKPRQDQDQEYDEEDDYDDEEEPGVASKSFYVGLDGQEPTSLANLSAAKRNQLTSFQNSAMDGGNQSRRDQQPVPDQRFYTKTNFFTINNGEGDSVADKYHNLQSQKSSRRPIPYNEPASQLRGPGNFDEFPPPAHQRMQSFTDGVYD